MAEASVRRRGTGDPEATFEHLPEKHPRTRTRGWLVGGAGKSFVVPRRHLVTPQAFADPRLASALEGSKVRSAWR